MNAMREICPADQDYRPPAGYFDKPYIYVSNYEQPVAAVPGTDPRAGLDFPNIQVPLKGDSEFILRKIWHYCPSAATRFLPYTPQGNQIASAPLAPTNMAIAPEMRFPPGGACAFDVVAWSSNDIPCGPNGEPHIFHTQFLFQGVRRFQGGAGEVYPRDSGYRYKEVPFTYRYNLPVTWPYLVFEGGVVQYNNLIKEPDRTDFAVQIQNYDFELLWCTCILTRSAAVNDQVVEGPNDNFKILLFDPDDRAISSDYIYIDAINFHTWPGNPGTTGVGVNTTQAGFPVPGILYPRGSYIRFNVRSMLWDTNTDGVPDIDTPAVRPFVLYFGGVRRVPC